MRLRKAHICGIWALGALAMIGNDARAQDASTASAAAAGVTSAGQQPSSRPDEAQPAQSNASTTTRSGSTVCFQFTLHCFSAHPAHAASVPSHSARNSAAAAATGSTANATTPPDVSAAPTSLNLTAPDIRSVVAPEELKEPLPSEDQQAQQADSQTVEVRTDPNTPNIPGGFGALWWAMLHPTQVWRIFTPVE